MYLRSKKLELGMSSPGTADSKTSWITSSRHVRDH